MNQPTEVTLYEDSGFRAYRLALIHESNETAFLSVAALLVLFNAWDWYVDPSHALLSLWVRLAGASVVVISGWFQRYFNRIELAAGIAKFRLMVSAGTIATALSLLDHGFLVGLSGLIIAMLGAAYSSIDRRDVFALFLPPLVLTMAIMLFAGIDRFVFINASCFLMLTMVVGWLLANVQEISYRRSYELEHALLRESRIDALTGVLNRRALEEQGKAALNLCQRHEKPFSVMMVDIDHFKAINDEHGHAAGDRVLIAVAEHCRGLIRESDRFGRWGGEEFLALLPETTLVDAVALAERMCHAIAASEFPAEDLVLSTTTSIGVAGGITPNSIDTAVAWAALVKAADEAMYRAKDAGRNCVDAE
ncbi:MAG: GGDEF domain-containing protein [Arenimonas sp.]